MAQLGFFDADKRLAPLSAKGDPLEAIEGLVPWESFRAEIEAVVLTPEAAIAVARGVCARSRGRFVPHWRRWTFPMCRRRRGTGAPGCLIGRIF